MENNLVSETFNIVLRYFLEVIKVCVRTHGEYFVDMTDGSVVVYTRHSLIGHEIIDGRYHIDQLFTSDVTVVVDVIQTVKSINS